MSMKFKNNASSELASAITASSTTLTVTTDTGVNFPSISSEKDYFHATIVGDSGDMEIVKVTAVNADTFTVVRAQEDTTAKDWPAGTRVENRITAEFLNMAVTGGDGGVTYIDVNADLNDLKEPGLYATREGQLLHMPSEILVKDTSPYYSVKIDSTIRRDGIVLVTRVGTTLYQLVFSNMTYTVYRKYNSATQSWENFQLRRLAKKDSSTGEYFFGISYPDNVTITQEHGRLTVEPAGIIATSSTVGTVKPDNTTTTVSSDGTISANPSGLIGDSGPDNYLEVVGDKLVVRGVQTAKNELWNCGYNGAHKGSTILSTAGDTKVNIVFDNVETLNSINKYNDPIVSLGDDHSTFTILKSGTYHFSANINLNATVGGTNIVELYKKVNTEWIPVTYGQPSLGLGNGVVRVDFDVHGRFNTGDILMLGISSNADVNLALAHYVEFQRFADAALLAPALTTMGNEIVAAACGTTNSVISYKSTPVLPGYSVYQVLSSNFAFTSEPRSTPNWENFFEFVKEGTNYVGVKVKKDGVYHARLIVYIVNNMNTAIGVGCAWTIVRDGAVINILDNLLNDSIEVSSSGAVSVDGHAVLKAGDILWLCVVKDPITTPNITRIVLDVQRFADTLEHPNHGISQDAGNIAQVGSDLGVYVPDIEIPTATTSVTGITRLATEDQAIAGEETGAYVLTPATGKALVEASNASTADKLKTARTISLTGDATGSATFDGSADSSIAVTVSQASNASTANKLKTARTITIDGDATGSASFDGSANATITVDVVNATNAVNATDAATANKLKTARTISLTGDATGSATFNGSANSSIAVTVSQASNASTWAGATKYVSTAAASGGVNGDVWFQYV